MRPLSTLLTASLLLGGCTDEVQIPSGSDHDLPEGSFGETVNFWLQDANRQQLDILFVIENSGGTGYKQATLQRSLASLAEELSDAGADYRIAFTTTDNGNPWCGTTSPEAGALVFSSCVDRESSFTNQAGTENHFDLACAERCGLSSADLGIGSESSPWLAGDVDGLSGLAQGVSLAEALACLAPQGIDGCGFEQPLTSMEKALIRSETQSDASYGFHRETAALVVVLLSEEEDCSHNNDYSSIFESTGGKVFWSDPDSNNPTSAICWNAGVQCTGDPSSLDCVAASYDSNGMQLDPSDPSTEDAAVLHPVQRFIDRVESHDEVGEYNADRTARVIAITGVDDEGALNYSSEADAEFLYNYGTAPGCRSEMVVTETACSVDDDCPSLGSVCGGQGLCEFTDFAFPPVRIAELAAEFAADSEAPPSLHSICADDYGPAMTEAVDIVRTQVEARCYAGDIFDTDPNTERLEPECLASKTSGASAGWGSVQMADSSGPMLECIRASDGSYEVGPEGRYLLPDDAGGACFVMLVDTSGATDSQSDDLPEPCAEAGHQLAIQIELDPTQAPDPITSAHAHCRLE
jgi:hypothetical protein